MSRVDVFLHGTTQQNASVTPVAVAGGAGVGSASPSSAFPDATNTGVPAGTTLTTYSGSTSFTSGTTTIDSKTINGDIQLGSGTAHVTITKSLINGHVDAGDGFSGSLLTLIDCEIQAGTFTGAAVGYNNVVLLRCNINGGGTSVNAQGNVTVTDSWLHNQYLGPVAGTHNNGLLVSGNKTVGPVNVQHCTVACDTLDNASGGGPTGPIAMFGDFDHLDGVTVNHCQIIAGDGGYAAALGYNTGKPFGSDPANIVYTNNIHTRRSPGGSCGVFGTSTGFLAGSGNVFSGNTYDDGTPLAANT